MRSHIDRQQLQLDSWAVDVDSLNGGRTHMEINR